MNTLRKFIIVTSILLLSFSISGIVGAHIAEKTIKNRDTVKSWFERSNFYEGIAGVIGEKIAESTTKNGGVVINDDAEVQKIIKEAFSSQMIKTNVESFINAVYAWLDGTSSTLQFSLDLRSAQQQIADGLAAYTTTRTSGLPVCVDQVAAEGFDVVSATCRPTALSPAEAGRLVKEAILGQDFLKNAVFTSQDLAITNPDGTKTPLDQSDAGTGIKSIYRGSSALMPVFIILGIISTGAILFLSSSKRLGLLWISLTLLANGLSLLFFYSIAGGILNATSNSLNISGTNPATTSLIIDFVKAVVSDVRSAMTGYMYAFIGGGVASLVGFWWLGKSRTTAPTDASQELGDSEVPNEEPVHDQKPTAETKDQLASKNEPKR